MLFGSKSILGLDIGSSAIKMVDLEPNGARMTLRHYGYEALPPEAIVQGSLMNSPAISNAIRNTCASLRAKGRGVATSVSGHSVIVKKISMPFMSEEELEQQIRWEAEQYIPFDINEVNVDYQILQEGGVEGQMEVLLVAAKKDLMDDYANVVSDAGLGLSILDVDAFALSNAYEFNYNPDPDSTVALVDVGASVVTISIMNGGIPVFTRDLSAGGNHYTEEIQKTLNITFEEAETLKRGGRGEMSKDVVPQEIEDAIRAVSETLVGEIQRSLDFYRATHASRTLEKVLLSGGCASVPGFDKLFQERIELPVEILDLLRQVDMPPDLDRPEDFRELAPAFAVAMGLGLRRVSES
jgi:type IV pilus assembly protein PilM